jgi:hypothetical protein
MLGGAFGSGLFRKACSAEAHLNNTTPAMINRAAGKKTTRRNQLGMGKSRSRFKSSTPQATNQETNFHFLRFAATRSASTPRSRASWRSNHRLNQLLTKAPQHFVAKFSCVTYLWVSHVFRMNQRVKFLATKDTQFERGFPQTNVLVMRRVRHLRRIVVADLW